jgi:hypothetical protein
MNSASLKEIITSILKEFEIANFNIEVSREHMRQFYESNQILSEFSPSKIRVSEAEISLPLAIEKIGAPIKVADSLTSKQLFRLIPSQIPLEKREALAYETINKLSKSRKHFFSNAYLSENVAEQLKKSYPELIDVQSIKSGINKLQSDFAQIPNKNRNTKFIFETNELEKISSDKIMKINFKIIVD